MYVCEKCHELDRNVTKCRRPWDRHSSRVRSVCSICGNKNVLSYCYHYGILQIPAADPIKHLERNFEQLFEQIKKREEVRNGPGLLEVSSKGSTNHPL